MIAMRMDLERVLPVVQRKLSEIACDLSAEGMPRIAVDGQLIRPLLAAAGAYNDQLCDRRFWFAAAAVQYAHEASLLHDDVVDGAAQRRGLSTVAASKGVAAALIAGDHLLSTAYYASAETGSKPFIRQFARAVERTIAGEYAQAKRQGDWLSDAEYEQVVAGKSGELIACALSTGAMLRNPGSAGETYELGQAIGVLYQRIDDLLDLLPRAHTGKPALQDYAQGKWTWPLAATDVTRFGYDPAYVAARLLVKGEGRPLEHCMALLREHAHELIERADALLPNPQIVRDLLGSWMKRIADAVSDALTHRRQQEHAAEVWIRSNAPNRPNFLQHFGANSKSFRFASTFLDSEDRDRIATLYCFCRFTDDLADTGPSHGISRLVLIDTWERLARDAYEGRATGIDLLDRAMADAARQNVPLHYVCELIEGMRMDLRRERYDSLADLRVYTYRVAGVLGQWMTRMHGITDPGTLDDAAALGHAMQLTNILRDVGEDWKQGRVYLPSEQRSAYRITDADIARIAETGAVSPEYAALLEALMSAADEDYERALAATPMLPPSFRRAVVVAARVYQGIHHEIRANHYNNGTRRARTSLLRKTALASSALATNARMVRS